MNVIKAILLLNTVLLACLLWQTLRLEDYIFDLFLDNERLEKLIKRYKDGDNNA